VRIVFQTPFTYLGGTLCVDVIVMPLRARNADWWMADAEFEDISGATLEIGQGCGAYGGAQHRWSHVAQRSLLPGAYARFWACGAAIRVGLALFGASGCAIRCRCSACRRRLQSLPEHVGRRDAGCLRTGAGPGPCLERWHRRSADPDPEQSGCSGLHAHDAVARVEPARGEQRDPMDHRLGDPALDMAVVEGHGQSSRRGCAHMAHVMRFEFQ
jgi:hypothetical protein